MTELVLQGCRERRLDLVEAGIRAGFRFSGWSCYEQVKAVLLTDDPVMVAAALTVPDAPIHDFYRLMQELPVAEAVFKFLVLRHWDIYHPYGISLYTYLLNTARSLLLTERYRLLRWMIHRWPELLNYADHSIRGTLLSTAVHHPELRARGVPILLELGADVDANYGDALSQAVSNNSAYDVGLHCRLLTRSRAPEMVSQRDAEYLAAAAFIGPRGWWAVRRLGPEPWARIPFGADHRATIIARAAVLAATLATAVGQDLAGYLAKRL